METDTSLLRAELQEEELYNLLQTVRQTPTDTMPSKSIRPQPGVCVCICSSGVCVKTFSLAEEQKVFVNICQSAEVPPPPLISHDSLVDLLDSDDPTAYKVPMSLGEAHTELDNSSNSCTVYDVVINDEFFQKCQDPLFQQFVIAVSLEGLENKYKLQLNRDIKILKNRKFMGSVSDQNIRTKSKPVIQEIGSEEIQSTMRRPQVCLVVEPPVGQVEYLIAEVQLPGVVSDCSYIHRLNSQSLFLSVSTPACLCLSPPVCLSLPSCLSPLLSLSVFLPVCLSPVLSVCLST
ncbi:PIH1 domain-containing protein 1 isoform X2 [Hemibagrus wyckioides]|uniref:PIH1 domain-containing protein 1 isoform X2 n=1 Tax=Hemibagrus wyckioides TaxID=337641 RepID=UPI00266BBA44|nr:PIH1 domain-containing protein 1 isoform X2 [Hemibagrus wyckioides]